MRPSLRHLRPGLASLLAWIAAAVLCPGPAVPRHLEFVQQQVDARVSLSSSLTVSEDGRHLYLAGHRSLVFVRDDVTGELGFVDAANGAQGMAISPDGRNLYAHTYGQLRVFLRHPEAGTPIFLEAWRDGLNGIEYLSPASVAVSPDGRHVYVVMTDALLAVFARDLRTGVLRHLETHYDGFDGVSGLYGARHLTVSPDGAHLYVVSSPRDLERPSLAVFGRDATTGGLSFVESLAGASDGAPLSGAGFLLVSPDGRHLYVAAFAGVLTYARDPSTGELSFAGVHDGLTNSIAASPDGRYLYAASKWGAVLKVLARDAGTGMLSLVEVFPDAAGGLRGAVAVSVTPDGRHLYLAGYNDDSVAAFTRDTATGTVGFVAAYEGDVEGDADGLEGAESVAASPDGRHLYAVSRYGDVAALSRSPETGELEFIAAYDESDGFDGLDDAASVAVSPDGRNVYVASRYPDHALAVLARDETTGELDFLEAHFDGAGGVDGLDYASKVSVSPDGRHVYVASSGDNAIAAFARDATTGELTFVTAYVDGAGGVDGIAGVRSLALSPGGEQVYTVSYRDGALAAFARDAETGELQFLEAHVDGVAGVTGLGGSPYDVAVSPDGTHVYVLNSGTAVVAFQRQAASGRLAFLDARFEDVTGAHRLEVSRDGEYVYVFGSEISVFSRQAATGALKLLEVESFPYYYSYWGPTGTQSPDGRHLYVVAALGGTDGVVALRRTDGACRSTAHSLCLAGNRFRFALDWRDHRGNTGSARAVPQGTGESGLLYYFNPDNWELQVKVIDACTYNDRFWVFAAGTTDVEYTLRVTDELAGVTRTYFNPLGNAAAAITDTAAFATCDSGTTPAARSAWELPAAAFDAAALAAASSAGALSTPLRTAADTGSGAGAAPGKDGELPYVLVGLGDKCLDVEGGGTADGTPVNLFACHRGPNQRWQFEWDCGYGGCSEDFEIQGHGGNCLQPGEETPSGRTPLVMAPCGGEEDRWLDVGIFPERLRLVHAQSGRCADVEGGSTADGTPVNLFECHEGANQIWKYLQVRCFSNPVQRCLNQSRFEVEVEWRDFAGDTGLGRAVSHGSADSGLFWFFTPENWEMLVKVLDGCGINGYHWVFAGATTNVEYTLRVTDTETGQVREYFNPLGRSAPAITDTSAFATCP